MRDSGIQWTTHTFNPWVGCQRVSPGCENCYAETRDGRFHGGKHWGPKGERQVTSAAIWRQPEKWNDEASEADVRARVFCASLADVFEDRPELVKPRERLFALIARTPNLDWQLLTKRPENMVRLAPPSWAKGWPNNVWAGTTVEDQRRADERIPHLLNVPARVRFLSCEPLLGAVDLGRWIERIDHCRNACGAENSPQTSDRCPECGRDGTLIATWGEAQAAKLRDGTRYEEHPIDDGPPLHWVIVGGESGPGARPFDVSWARSILSQCREASVPVFVKQLGSVPVGLDAGMLTTKKGGDPAEWPEDLRVREFPEVRHA